MGVSVTIHYINWQMPESQMGIFRLVKVIAKALRNEHKVPKLVGLGAWGYDVASEQQALSGVQQSTPYDPN